jgi:hypothetical protein
MFWPDNPVERAERNDGEITYGKVVVAAKDIQCATPQLCTRGTKATAQPMLAYRSEPKVQYYNLSEKHGERERRLFHQIRLRLAS